ncbi:major facilitator superfamily domain-containing protein [Trichoderma evansii]
MSSSFWDLITDAAFRINSAYSIFLAHYLQNNTFKGATKIQYGFVGTLSVSCALLVAPCATIFVRKCGTRPTMLSGSLLVSVSLICSSLSTEIWQLFLCQGGLFGVGMGLLFLPSYGIVAQWFSKRRALANGIAIAGGGAGGLIYSLSSNAMIQNLGLPWAFRILSIVTFVANTVSILLIRTRYEETGSRQLAFDTSLLKRPEYILILAFGFLTHYANELGLDASQAAVIPALLMLGQAIGRPLIGYLCDSIGSINITTLTTFLVGVLALTVWVNAKSYGVLIFFAIAEGLVAGVFWVTVGPIMADVIGLESLPPGLTLLWLTLVLPTTFSEPIALQIVGRTGDYIGVQIFTGLVFVAAALCIVSIVSQRLY